MAVTLSTLKSRARQAADMENSTFVGDTELLNMINSSYQELYDLIVDVHEDYFVTSSTFSLVAGDAGVYALPAAFYKLRGLDFLVGGEYVALFPFQWSQRNSRNDRIELGYRIMGSNLRLEPNANAVGSYRLWYIPAMTALAVDADNLDTMITRAGWEEYIVVDVARKLRIKEESSVDALVSAKQALVARINAAAANRDADQPATVSDTSEARARASWAYDGW